ncbi:hypothetical protein D3C72_1611420 [compost metagenome]
MTATDTSAQRCSRMSESGYQAIRSSGPPISEAGRARLARWLSQPAGSSVKIAMATANIGEMTSAPMTAAVATAAMAATLPQPRPTISTGRAEAA